jgi:hypothetical protein
MNQYGGSIDFVNNVHFLFAKFNKKFYVKFKHSFNDFMAILKSFEEVLDFIIMIL